MFDAQNKKRGTGYRMVMAGHLCPCGLANASADRSRVPEPGNRSPCARRLDQIPHLNVNSQKQIDK